MMPYGVLSVQCKRLHPARQVCQSISLEAGEAVVSAFIHAFSLALIGVILTLLILLKDIKTTLLALAPLLLAALFTGACTSTATHSFQLCQYYCATTVIGHWH